MEFNEYGELPVEEQEAVARQMEKLGMQMGVFAPRVGSWEVPNFTGNILDPKSRIRDKEGLSAWCAPLWSRLSKSESARGLNGLQL